MKNFTKLYTYINQTGSHKKFTKEGNKTCRYCGLSKFDTTFDNKPHVLSQLFGKNNFTWNEECDTCNNEFQVWESHMSTFINPYLSLFGTGTAKGKVPQFRSRKKKGEKATILTFENGNRHLNLDKNIGDLKYISETESELNLRSRSFNPFKLNKLFLKMSISLIPHNDSNNLKYYLECLNEEGPNLESFQFYNAIRYFMKSKMFTSPSMELYRANKLIVDDQQLPEYVLILKTSTLIFQFVLPLSINNLELLHKCKIIKLDEYYPFFIHEDITQLKQIEFKNMDLSVNKNVTIDESIRLFHDKRNKI